MPGTLASVLDAARVRAFVGRADELAAFQSAMTGPGPHRVLFVTRDERSAVLPAGA